jgi:hypothetical protein
MLSHDAFDEIMCEGSIVMLAVQQGVNVRVIKAAACASSYQQL